MTPAEVWSALIEGRATLVEAFDAAGRRFVVAQCAPGRPLSALEREVVVAVAGGRPQKVVALELDMSPSAVCEALARALDKLRMSSVTELTRVASALGAC